MIIFVSENRTKFHIILIGTCLYEKNCKPCNVASSSRSRIASDVVINDRASEMQQIRLQVRFHDQQIHVNLNQTCFS